MRYYEYIYHRVNGESVKPDFVEDGPYWTHNNTHIACVPNNRDYWIPDSLVELTEEELIERVKAIHAETPYQFHDMALQTSRDMTEQEVEDMVNRFIADHQEVTDGN
jgi:hypothetical protein